MGAWGTGPFDNDAASDWVLAVVDRGIEELSLALEVAAESQEMIGSLAASEAVAAAEVVSAARGFPCSSYPEELKEWASSQALYADRKLTTTARQAVRRVLADSELAEDWAGNSGWKRRMNHLLERLSRPSKAKRPRKAKPVAKSPASQSATARSAKVQAADSRAATFPAADPQALIKRIRKLGGSVSKTRTGEIEGVDLTDAGRLTNADLPVVAEFPGLEFLAVYLERFEAHDLEVLERLPHLKELHLICEEPLGDAHLAVLGRLKTLEKLSIPRTEASDRGLQQLASLPGLHTLKIPRAGVPARGLAAFRKKRPECTIVEPAAYDY